MKEIAGTSIVAYGLGFISVHVVILVLAALILILGAASFYKLSQVSSDLSRIVISADEKADELVKKANTINESIDG
jgi:uncharacterized protein (UPF0333 family)